MSGTRRILEQLLQRDDTALALCQHDRHTQLLRWSFRDLQDARRYSAGVLRAAGLQRGDRLLLACGDLPHFLAIFLAALELELCLLPLHPDQDLSCLLDILQEQVPVLAIVDTAARPLFERARAQLPQCLLLTETAADWLQRMQSPPGGEVAGQPVRARRTADPDGCAIIFHSSGSTGRAKALYYSRAQLETFLHWQQRLFAAFDDEAPGRALAGPEGDMPSPRINVLPLAHWGGLSFCLQALSEGRGIHLQKNFQADALLHLVDRTGCRLLMLVPAMYREMLPLLEQQCPSSLRYCLTMGEAMPVGLADSLRRKQGLLLCTAYGMSEALSGLAHGAVPLQDVPHGSCGQQAFGEMKLVSSEGETQPDSGEAEGELWVRNATTVPCYRDAALLQARYVDGWFRTGDCFRRDSAGHYYFRNRLDAMCVHNGRNVYPQQVEAVFIEHPAVQACVAVPLDMPDGGRRIGVCIVPARDADLSTQSLMDHYLLHGAHYAAPAFMLLTDSLPATWSGKPGRAGVAALLQEACNAARSNQAQLYQDGSHREAL